MGLLTQQVFEPRGNYAEFGSRGLSAEIGEGDHG